MTISDDPPTDEILADEIVAGRTGRLGTILLNRPKALNALTLGMFRLLDPLLTQWEADPTIAALLVRGAGERAFCAGGDVRAVYEAGRGADPAFPALFFGEEYALIRRIHCFPKPYIALMDGVTMGGGAGIAINGTYRVATEKTLLAMPETAIGLFPDVGATRFLNLCPGRIGIYLGLTGARIRAADILFCGFATHYVPQSRLAELVAALAEAGASGIESVLRRFAGDPGPAPLAGLQPVIDRCFAGDTVEAIVAALAEEAASGSAHAEWAAEQYRAMLARSPTSLKITLRQLSVGLDYDVEAALSLEYRLTQHVMAAHDFYEGVRAVLVDKDHQPRWQPATLDAVSDSEIDKYFARIGDAELRFDRI